MVIDGFYNLSGTVNGKQAWQKSDGISLRWASIWTQWIFDDDTQDFTSIAWKSADASSTAPEIGTFSDYLYGSTCGNNAQVVDSLTITRIDCTTGNRVMKCASFLGGHLGQSSVKFSQAQFNQKLVQTKWDYQSH